MYKFGTKDLLWQRENLTSDNMSGMLGKSKKKTDMVGAFQESRNDEE